MVAAQWLMRGTNTGSLAGAPPTGQRVALPGADFVTVTGDRIRAVQGYFDQRLFAEQLGLQVMVQPTSAGPFSFGRAAYMPLNPGRPGAISLTTLQVRSDAEVEKVMDYTQRISGELGPMPGFMSLMATVVGHRMCTISAWEDPESPGQLLRGGAHKEAMERFFGQEIGTGGQTSVWVPHRYNRLWVRCAACERMADAGRPEGKCVCGAVLPRPPAWW
jgi:hypothetical protein